MTVIDLYWTVHADEESKAGQLVEAARNANPGTLEVIRGWVEQLTAQAVLRTGTAITVDGDTATIRQPRRRVTPADQQADQQARQPEPELTLKPGNWIVHAGSRLLVVDDETFRQDYSAEPRLPA